MYVQGKGVPKSDAESARWMMMAAKQGHADAQVQIGSHYRYFRILLADGDVSHLRGLADAEKENGGRNLQQTLQRAERQHAEAIRWYKLAAEQGHPMGQYHLAFMHWKGEGVPKDNVVAHAWANIANAHHQPAAPDLIERIE